MSPVLEARGIKRDYLVPQGLFSAPKAVHAVKGVSFAVEKGKTLAIVGESGCGKSTLARILTLIDAPTAGELYIDGERMDASQSVTSAMRRKVQIVFQNPYGSLNPRQKIGEVLTKPLLLNTDVPAADFWHAAEYPGKVAVALYEGRPQTRKACLYTAYRRLKRDVSEAARTLE